MKRKATFQQVARIAGVSGPTVSRLATGKSRVSPEIAERVKKAAIQLGVDLFRRKRSKVIAFILSNRGALDNFESKILAGAEACCVTHGWNILFVTLRYEPGVPGKRLHLPPIILRRDLVGGLVVTGTNYNNLLDSLTHSGIPFSVLGNSVRGQWRPEEHDVVWFDDVQGAYQITRYVLSLGHCDFWFVGNTRLAWYSRRYQGYANAMQEAGYEPRHSQMESDDDRDIGFLATKSMVDEGQPVCAIFAGSDRMADGVYHGLRDSGLRIPEDVSVVGFDDLEATVLHPHLTTVRVFIPEVGEHLTKLVLRRIESPGGAPQRFTLPTELVRRESCSPPRVAGGASREVAVEAVG